MTLVKICGITNLADARHAIDCGADQLGFNFYEKSVRSVPLEDARKIVLALPVGCVTIGVFVNKKADEVLDIVDFVGLDGIQLHGDEDFEYSKELMRRTEKFIIKAFRVSSQIVVEDAKRMTVPYTLLDAYSPNALGGTGMQFDWNIASDVSFLRPESLYLAGGLNPENVADAIRIVRPYAVDVASGVESSPGKKDPEKVAAFVRAVRQAI
jgi:phosphoribosylanthranilate isomerase